MSAKRKNEYKCPYGECKLPQDNYLLFAQFAYLVVCFFILVADSKAITAFSIFMYVCPLFFDIIGLCPTKKIISWIKTILGIIMASHIIGCFLVFGKFFIDTGENFKIVGTSALMPGVEIPKMVIVITLAVFSGTPWLLYAGRNTKNKIKIKQTAKTLETKSTIEA